MIKVYLFDYDEKTNTDALLRSVIDGAVIVREAGKKPYLSSPKGCFFSISHSASLCAVAVCDREVGVDIEKRREINGAERIARRFYSEKERESDFFDVWVRKESRVKRDGTTLWAISPSCATTGEDITALKMPQGYAGALCTEGAANEEIQIYCCFDAPL